MWLSPDGGPSEVRVRAGIRGEAGGLVVWSPGLCEGQLLKSNRRL